MKCFTMSLKMITKKMSNSALLFKFLTVALLTIGTAGGVNAQILVEDPTQEASGKPAAKTKKVRAPAAEGDSTTSDAGSKEASQYFEARKKQKSKSANDKLVEPEKKHLGLDEDHYLAIYYGGYLNDKQHRWGGNTSGDDVADGIFGVNYRVGEWVSSMDLYFRGEINTFSLDNKDPYKISLMAAVAFPDARSEFPLYFGLGAGPGIFFSQLEDESDVSLDYVLFAGARVFQLFSNVGIMVEGGLRGHLHLLSSGQHEGVFVAAGAVFGF
jgi:hypothetical protein